MRENLKEFNEVRIKTSSEVIILSQKKPNLK